MTEDSGKKEHIVCPFCGCLCDDITLTVEGNKITDNKNGCSISQAKFQYHHDDRLEMEAPLEELVKRAAEIIVNSKRLLVYGLSSTENDAHREAYKIAEEAGGVVDNTSSVCHGPTILGAQESGESIAALAETRHRADLIIYWGSNPQFAHPRHMSRYTRADGMYIKDGKKDRKIWVVDVRKTIGDVFTDTPTYVTEFFGNLVDPGVHFSAYFVEIVQDHSGYGFTALKIGDHVLKDEEGADNCGADGDRDGGYRRVCDGGNQSQFSDRHSHLEKSDGYTT